MMTTHLNRNRAQRSARLLTALALAALVAACGSTVKLDEPAPVKDATPVGQSGGTGPTSSGNLPLVGADVGRADGGSARGNTTAGSNAAKEVAPVRADTATAAAPPNGVARVVYFDYDSDSIKPEFQTSLEAHAKFLRGNPARRMALEGHTDERGGREYNLALGQRRAEAVSRALQVLGVTDAQTEAVSFGKEKPAAQGTSEAVFSQNRRTELFYK